MEGNPDIAIGTDELTAVDEQRSKNHKRETVRILQTRLAPKDNWDIGRRYKY